MNMRKITSMTMLLSLIVLAINSIILYAVPEGRIAYWADWRFLGLTKGDWSAQHTTVGVLFLIAGILHIFYNWKPIAAYMKNKTRQIRVFTGPFNIALAATAVFIVGTYYNIPPMSTILDISESLKDSATVKYGEPPYGHAESSSLNMFAKRENLDPEKSVLLLREAGLVVKGPEDTIKDIAAINKLAPKQIHDLIKPAALPEAVVKSSSSNRFPDAPESGWGKKKLSEACDEYGLKLDYIIRELGAKGVVAKADMIIKDIAEANNLDPMGVFEVMHEIAASSNC
ncbi:MAG: DUF4405 domain-containing protein [Desulfofustis sp.]|jgi:hypothetical protein|nr:DUF4405 domain-containing protein [Desulfofustis sp.]